MSSPASPASTEVRPAGSGDVPALSRALAASFMEDPVWSWLLPDRSRRAARLERFFALELSLVGLEHGTVCTNPGRDGAVIATPPGQWRLPWAAAIRNGPRYLRAFGARLPIAMALQDRMERRHLREPHHYVAYVGVAPPAQGHGLGTALLQPVLDACDEGSLPAYLEATCPRNIALYERLGFVAGGEVRIRDSPPLTLMTRPPRTRPG